MRKSSAFPAALGVPPTTGDGGDGERDAANEKDGAAAAEFIVASHTALFEGEGEPRCDACGALVLEDPAEDGGYDVPGSGVYLWSRGGEVEWEGAPLCASCASAIGMTALARFEIEEEEG